MRLPRRVPWASIAELEHLCSSIYTDENDLNAKTFAINRISAWKAITTLPHAVESTLALLVVIVQDTIDKQNSTQPLLLLRQSYATAIIRLVNGLVDPLQVGTFARAITSIAQQLGLPSWLVELRHAATHEDLPSIDLLREGARQSMAWLLHNYYLPTLNPIQELAPSAPPRPLLPILTCYKDTMKTVTRDVSILPRHRPNLITVLRDLERWIAECKVAANAYVAVGQVGFGGEYVIGGADFKEIWALESFCDGLAEKGMLVPLSKKKREHSHVFHPSKASISYWELLLQHVHSMHPEFPFVLCRRFVSILLSSDSNTKDMDPQRPDPSYDTYLACWTKWAVDTWGATLPELSDLRREILSTLMKGIFGPPFLQKQPAPFELLKALSAGQEQLELVTTMLSNPQIRLSANWDPQYLDVMNERHHQLQTALVVSDEVVTTTSNFETKPQQIDLPGWRLLDEKLEWEPCPIGVFYSHNLKSV